MNYVHLTKILNLFRLSYALTSIFIIKNRFQVNAEISSCVHGINLVLEYLLKNCLFDECLDAFA